MTITTRTTISYTVSSEGFPDGLFRGKATYRGSDFLEIIIVVVGLTVFRLLLLSLLLLLLLLFVGLLVIC